MSSRITDSLIKDIMERVDECCRYVFVCSASGIGTYLWFTRVCGDKSMTYGIESVFDPELRRKKLYALNGYLIVVSGLFIVRTIRDAYRCWYKYRDGVSVYQNEKNGQIKTLTSERDAIVFGMRNHMTKNYIRSTFFPIYGPLSFSLWVIKHTV